MYWLGLFCLKMCLYLCGWPRAAFGVEGAGLFLPEADIYIGGGGEDCLTLGELFPVSDFRFKGVESSADSVSVSIQKHSIPLCHLAIDRGTETIKSSEMLW